MCDWKEHRKDETDPRGIVLLYIGEGLEMKCMECGKEARIRWKEDGDKLKCLKTG